MRHLRPADLARAHGLSTQAVRNYEAAGILPAADRTANGYRSYTRFHAQALAAFLALVPGHGHQRATEIMRAVNGGATEEALRLIDETHAELRTDRRTLGDTRHALRELAGPAGVSTPPEPALGSGTRFIGPLAHELGLRPATLRAWERAGLVRPGRDPQTGYRVYDATAVRDARLTHQLRRGGYLLAQIAPLVDRVRAAQGWSRSRPRCRTGTTGCPRAGARCSPGPPSWTGTSVSVSGSRPPGVVHARLEPVREVLTQLGSGCLMPLAGGCADC